MDSCIELHRASTLLSLRKEAGHFVLDFNGLELMSTDLTHSEQMLAELACAEMLDGAETRPEHPRVLMAVWAWGSRPSGFWKSWVRPPRWRWRT